jgi:hypothetical protein
MKTFVIRQGYNYGYYFVEGKGFSGSLAQATRVSAADLAATQACLARSGNAGYTEVAPVTSFAVNYVRKANLTTGRASNGSTRNSVGPDANNPSAKRFASVGEAHNHAQRNLEGDGRDAHVGYWVTESVDPVTHFVSTKVDPKGLTCPIGNK